MSHVIPLKDANFKSLVLESDLPVLVDFWASWCPPCKMTEPVVEALAAEYEGRLTVGKLNVDQNPRTADQCNVLGVPTFAVFRAGQIVARRTGAQSKAQLQRLLREVV